VLVHSDPSRAPKVEAIRKKERHENTKEKKTLLERLVNQVDNQWPTNKLGMESRV